MKEFKKLHEVEKSEEIVTVEYSLNQGCFHIDELSSVLKYNQQNVLSHSANDYLLLALTSDVNEAQEFCREFGALIAQYNE